MLAVPVKVIPSSQELPSASTRPSGQADLEKRIRSLEEQRRRLEAERKQLEAERRKTEAMKREMEAQLTALRRESDG